MQSSYSTKLLKSSKTLSKAAKKHLEYFNPKGASNRKLHHNFRKNIIDLSTIYRKFSNDYSSPEKQICIHDSQKSLKILKNHSDLARSTKALENLALVSSRETSVIKLIPLKLGPIKLAPIKHASKNLTPQPSLPKLDKLSEIVDSCEKISKLNKSDIIITHDLAEEHKGVYKKAEDFIEKRSDTKIHEKCQIECYKRMPDKLSMEKLKKETFETTYYVEKKLRKTTVKKLREKIMPWKKVVQNNM